MKRLGLALIVVASMLVILAPAAFAGGPCQQKICPGGGPPLIPPGHDEGSPSPVRISPSNRILIDITGAGVKISNPSEDGIVIDITGAGILIDITGAGLINRFKIR
jgi:hypothetical protein